MGFGDYVGIICQLRNGMLTGNILREGAESKKYWWGDTFFSLNWFDWVLWVGDRQTNNQLEIF